MLKTVWLTKEKEGGVSLLLGGFDGLHLGHRYLLSRAKEKGSPVGVMTIFGGKNSQSLFTEKERRDIFQRNGADFTFELAFEEIKDISADDFLKLLLERFQVKCFLCGEDFRFGAGAAGTPLYIKTYGQVSIESYPLVSVDGEKVSSSTIKNALKDGDLEKANLLLEEEFFLIGEVIKDRQVGRTIGFPTANVLYPKEKFPLKLGVYETETEVDGKKYKGITNYGARPTFGDESVLTETYLDGFSGDLYGKEIKIRFKRFLRDIQKFQDAEALKAQLEKDVERVRNYD